MLVDSGLRYVAFFDLLGFSAWVRAEGSYEVFRYVRGFLNLMIRSSLPGSTVHPDMSVSTTNSDIGYVNFSDSVVFYTRDDSDICLETILVIAGQFMNGVITGPSRMLRGGIAFGAFFADPEANAYVGQALIDAYRLEESQDWLSCSIAPSVQERPGFQDVLAKFPNYIVPALVPLRDGITYPYCLNWADRSQFPPRSFNAERGIADCESRARQALGGQPEELEKVTRRVEKTRAFLRHYQSP